MINLPAAAGDRARKRQGLDNTHACAGNESKHTHLIPAAAGDRARVGQGLDRKPNAAADVFFVAHGGQ